VIFLRAKDIIASRSFFASLFLLVATFTSTAQKTTIYVEPDREFKIGEELFDKKKFGAAMKSFQNIIESHKNKKDLIRIDA